MVAVPLGESEVAAHRKRHGLDLAAVNGPNNTVLSGPPEAVAALEEALDAEGLACQRLQTSHAFHSQQMAPLVDELVELVSTFELSPPRIPYVSNVTGTWITAAEATDPTYWGRHLCGAVRFADGLRTLCRDPQALLEVGPGNSLTSAVKQHPDLDPAVARLTFSTMASTYTRQGGDLSPLLAALGRLWLSGHEHDPAGFYADEQRRRIPLPTYPFQRQRHWLDMDPEAFATGRPAATGEAPSTRRVTLDKEPDLANWFYRPHWRPLELPEAPTSQDAQVRLLFLDSDGVGQALSAPWQEAGDTVYTVVPGDEFTQDGNAFTLSPAEPSHYEQLLQALGNRPQHILHLWALEDVTPETSFEASSRSRFLESAPPGTGSGQAQR